MTSHGYPTARMLPDYLLAAAGLVLSIGPLALLEVIGWAVYALSALGILCAVHLGQTVGRHRTRIAPDDEGLAVSPQRVRIDWHELGAVKLSYFSVRKDGEEGWMEMRIDAPGRSVRFDSRIDAFDELVVRVIAAGREKGLELDDVTELNLASMSTRQSGRRRTVER